MSPGRLILVVLAVAAVLACATCGQDRTPLAVKSDVPAANDSPKGVAPQEAESCVEPAEGPIGTAAEGSPAQGAAPVQPARGSVRPGDPAPDFEAAAFVDKGFKNVKLSDFRGKWVVLCFYPGDFTFV